MVVFAWSAHGDYTVMSNHHLKNKGFVLKR